jgi:phosphate transport system protein
VRVVSGRPSLEQGLTQLFALVTDALAGATEALLGCNAELGRRIVERDLEVDERAGALESEVWARIEAGELEQPELRHLISLLLIVPELERSADLAEHVAQRAVMNVGALMTPVSRGYVQRMSEVAIEMWVAAADAYVERSTQGPTLDEADEEIDILRRRLREEVGRGEMTANVAGEVTLLGRFYERLGDHAVNLARRIDSMVDTRS